MAKEIFNWKGLFINEDDQSSKQTEKTTAQTFGNKFPDQSQQIQYTGTNSPPTTNPFLNEILEVYEKGFESLNVSGFDFFEMYKSVMAVGVTNPQSYQMAFTMGKTIKADLSKEFLLEKAKFYISEIEKVYAKYDAVGKSKKTNLDNHITAEKFNLSKNIEELEAKILQMQNELEAKKAELLKVDSGSMQEYSEIQLKIDANNYAKNKILDSINTVVTGINQYL